MTHILDAIKCQPVHLDQIYELQQCRQFCNHLYIFQNIAQFHAVPIAMKIKNPSTFMELIKPYLHHTDVFTQSMPEEMQNSSVSLLYDHKIIPEIVDVCRLRIS